MPQNVCIYQKLENTSLVPQALYNLDGNVPLCLHVLPEPITCSDNDGKCWSSLCEICKISQLFSELYHLDETLPSKEMGNNHGNNAYKVNVFLIIFTLLLHYNAKFV